MMRYDSDRMGWDVMRIADLTNATAHLFCILHDRPPAN